MVVGSRLGGFSQRDGEREKTLGEKNGGFSSTKNI